MTKPNDNTRPPKVLFGGIDPLAFAKIEAQLATSDQEQRWWRQHAEDATGVAAASDDAGIYARLRREPIPRQLFGGVARWHHDAVLKALARERATASNYARLAGAAKRAAERRAADAEAEAQLAKAGAESAERTAQAVTAQFVEFRASLATKGYPAGLIAFGAWVLRLALLTDYTTALAKPLMEAGEEIADAVEEPFVSTVSTTMGKTHDVLGARVREATLLAALIDGGGGAQGQFRWRPNGGGSSGQSGGANKAGNPSGPTEAPLGP